jgi:hypothetical protein
MTQPGRLLTIAMVVAIWPVIAEGGFCFPPTVEKEDPYRFISSLVSSLSYAKAALDRGRG